MHDDARKYGVVISTNTKEYEIVGQFKNWDEAYTIYDNHTRITNVTKVCIFSMQVERGYPMIEGSKI